jgi:hypothetical protein
LGVLLVRPNELDEWEFKDVWFAYVGRQNEWYEKEKPRWEQARFVAYYSGLGNFKKGTKMNSLVTFEWEKQKSNIKGTHGNKWTKEEIEKLKDHPIFR